MFIFLRVLLNSNILWFALPMLPFVKLRLEINLIFGSQKKYYMPFMSVTVNEMWKVFKDVLPGNKINLNK